MCGDKAMRRERDLIKTLHRKRDERNVRKKPRDTREKQNSAKTNVALTTYSMIIINLGINQVSPLRMVASQVMAWLNQ